MCNQFFHDIQITGLKEGTSYYYQLQAANGTTESDIMTFTTALAAGKNEEFTVAMINDMGVSLNHQVISHHVLFLLTHRAVHQRTRDTQDAREGCRVRYRFRVARRGHQLL